MPATGLLMLRAASSGAIIWDLITWLFGLPTSSSHALIGGYAGAAIMRSGFQVIIVAGVFVIGIIVVDRKRDDLRDRALAQVVLEDRGPGGLVDQGVHRQRRIRRSPPAPDRTGARRSPSGQASTRIRGALAAYRSRIRRLTRINSLDVHEDEVTTALFTGRARFRRCRSIA